MSKNKIVWAIAFGLVLYGIYQCWQLFSKFGFAHLTYVLFYLISAYGLIYKRKWSIYLIYILSITNISGWLDIFFSVFMTCPLKTVFKQ